MTDYTCENYFEEYLSNNSIIVASRKPIPAVTYNVNYTGSSGTTYYKMRGYYVTGATYETYVVTNAPSSTPPSGHVLYDVVVVATWTN